MSLTGIKDVDVKKFIRKYPDVTEGLLEASKKGDLTLVKYFLKNGADIHYQKDEALRLASGNGHLEVVNYLVENGASVNTVIFELVSKTTDLNILLGIEQILSSK